MKFVRSRGGLFFPVRDSSRDSTLFWEGVGFSREALTGGKVRGPNLPGNLEKSLLSRKSARRRDSFSPLRPVVRPKTGRGGN